MLSVLSEQLEGPNPLAAALNLYSKTPDAFDEDAVVTAQISATHAGNAIAANAEREQLVGARQTRHLIGVAQGMLMRRYELSEPQAFQFLARNSQDRNIKLRVIAAQVVAELAKHRWPTEQRPAPGDG